MNSDTLSNIQNKWDSELCPIINGILFLNGQLWSYDYLDIEIRGVSGRSVKLREVNPSQISSTVQFSTLTERDTSLDIERGRIYSCGEGGFGSDGYVSCVNSNSGELEWIAFFEESNPFVLLKVMRDHIEATNSHGHIWCFEKESPINIIVI